MKKTILLTVILTCWCGILPFSRIGCALETARADEITLKRDDGTEETFRISHELIEKAAMLVVRFSPFIISSWQGKVVEIVRADEIKVMKDDLSVENVRLYGIDGPIAPNPFGKEAAEFSAKLVLGKIVKVQPLLLPDPWSRTIAWVSLDGVSVNEELLKNGIVWWFRKYVPWEKQLAKLESEARQAKLGLWALPPTAAPWEMQELPAGQHANHVSVPTEQPISAAKDTSTKEPANAASAVPTVLPASIPAVTPANEPVNTPIAAPSNEERANTVTTDDLAPRRGAIRERLISQEGAPKKVFGDAGSVRQRLKSETSEEKEPATE